MEKLASRINLIVVVLLVLSAAVIFFVSVIGGNLAVALFGGCLTFIGIKILKITINETTI